MIAGKFSCCWPMGVSSCVQPVSISSEVSGTPGEQLGLPGSALLHSHVHLVLDRHKLYNLYTLMSFWFYER